MPGQYHDPTIKIFMLNFRHAGSVINKVGGAQWHKIWGCKNPTGMKGRNPWLGPWGQSSPKSEAVTKLDFFVVMPAKKKIRPNYHDLTSCCLTFLKQILETFTSPYDPYDHFTSTKAGEACSHLCTIGSTDGRAFAPPALWLLRPCLALSTHHLHLPLLVCTMHLRDNWMNSGAF